MPETATSIDLELLAEQKDLPSLPQVTGKLLEMLNDPKVNGQEVSRILRADPALAGRTLRMVNSPYYGVRQKVTSINQALALLGFRQVRAVVMSAAVDGLFCRSCRNPHFDQQGFSLHAIASAAVAQHLAKTTGSVDPELAFSLGLLHDIGKLAMDQCFPDHYSALYQKAQSEGSDLIEAERTREQPGHPRIGGVIARNWGLPDELVNGIIYHHDGRTAPNPKLTSVMAITHYICGVKGSAAPDNFAENHLDRDAWKQLQLQGDSLPALLSTVDDHIAAVRQMFEL